MHLGIQNLNFKSDFLYLFKFKLPMAPATLAPEWLRQLIADVQVAKFSLLTHVETKNILFLGVIGTT